MEKKILLAAVKRCMLVAFIPDIFDVCFMQDRLKKTPLYILWDKFSSLQLSVMNWVLFL